MTLSDADYQAVKARLARDTLSVNVLHVTGNLDCRSLTTRTPLQIGAGAHLLSGFGVPSALLGVNGDYYLRDNGVASNHLYFKASGTWAAVV
jgi:hypothetical protein